MSTGVATAVAKQAVGNAINVKGSVNLPKKPEKKVLFSFTCRGEKIGWSPHWTEILFIVMIIVSIVMLAVLGSPETSDAQRETFSSAGGWVSVVICVIIMWYNWGLFDRKRNAESAAYLAGYVQELAAHNKELRDATGEQQNNIDSEKRRQEKSKATLSQLNSVVDQLGDTKAALGMLKVGLDKFLEQNMKQLAKLEVTSREAQITMMDRGLDRLKELLTYSFYGLDDDKSSTLEGQELQDFLVKLRKYGILETKEEFFEVFPITLDSECGDSENLIEYCLASKNGKKLSNAEKDQFRSAVNGILPENDDSDMMLTESSHKKQYLDLVLKFKIASSVGEYFDTVHCIERYGVNEGMDDKTENLKVMAKKILIDYDNTLVELAAKEAELKKKHPVSGQVTKIEFDEDILAAAKS
jgi:predicted negative regulator of RcsB-dependent stress response